MTPDSPYKRPSSREKAINQGSYCPVCGRWWLAAEGRLEAHFDMGDARFDRPCPGTETRTR